MTTTQEPTNTRLPKPLYAVAGAGELAYRRLQRLPEQVEALRAEMPARVNTLVAEARTVYGDLVAHGEKVFHAAWARRNGESAATAIAKAPVKAVRKAVKKAVKKATPRA